MANLMSETKLFTVKLFAHVRSRHGESIEVQAVPTVRGLLEAMQEAGICTESCRVAVNHEFADMDASLSAIDELALIPPVSGG